MSLGNYKGDLTQINSCTYTSIAIKWGLFLSIVNEIWGQFLTIHGLSLHNISYNFEFYRVSVSKTHIWLLISLDMN